LGHIAVDIVNTEAGRDTRSTKSGCGYVEEAIRINFKRDKNLLRAGFTRGDATERKLASQMTLACFL